MNRRKAMIMLLLVPLLILTIVAVEKSTLLNQTSQQTQTTYPIHSTPLLNLNYLNASVAKQYGIHGLLTVGSQFSNGQNLTARPGQLLQITIKLDYVSYDSAVNSVVVSFLPQAGQEMVGPFDVSSLETFSPATVTVSATQPATVVMSFQVPSNASPLTFKLVPSGVNVSPSPGVAVLLKNDITVTIP